MLSHDWDRVVAALVAAEELVWFERQAVRFELKPWEWPAVPSLRTTAVNMAIVILAEAESSDGSLTKDGIDTALEQLGLEDDTDRATSPADSFLTKLRQWQRRGAQVPPPPAELLAMPLLWAPAEPPKKIIPAPPWETDHITDTTRAKDPR
jgi:hypothetical protein